MKTPRITKDTLAINNAILNERVRVLSDEDTRLRKIFSIVLGKYETRSNYGNDILSWEEILFYIGDLKAKVECSNLVERSHVLESENRVLQAQLYELKNKDKQIQGL